jgi:hypothetical protein
VASACLDITEVYHDAVNYQLTRPKDSAGIEAWRAWVRGWGIASDDFIGAMSSVRWPPEMHRALR